MALGDIRERKFEVSTQTGHVMGTSVPVRVVSTKPGEGQLTSAMLRLGGSPDLRRQLGDAGRQKAAREFDWERQIDKILEVYSDVMAPRERPNSPLKVDERTGRLADAVRSSGAWLSSDNVASSSRA